MKVIVHGDDFGLSKKVNEGIIQAHKKGILTSTSIMACGAEFDDAIRHLKNNKTLDVGIHLSLIEERPLNAPELIPTLIFKDGLFYPHAKNFMWRYLGGKISLNEIKIEFVAQIEKVIKSGTVISHIDSHQHIHILPKIFNLTAKLAMEYGIRTIRVPNEKLRFYMFKKIKKYHRLLQLLVIKSILTLVKSNFDNSNQFFGFYYGGRLNLENLKIVIDHLSPNSISEIMCHPGFKDPSSRYSHWHYEWQEEFDALTDAEILAEIERKGVVLSSFSD